MDNDPISGNNGMPYDVGQVMVVVLNMSLWRSGGCGMWLLLSFLLVLLLLLLCKVKMSSGVRGREMIILI